MVVKRAAKAATSVSPDTVENGGHSGDMFVTDLDEKADGSSSAKATVSRGFADIKIENAFKEAVASCFPVEWKVGKWKEMGFRKDGGLRRTKKNGERDWFA